MTETATAVPDSSAKPSPLITVITPVYNSPDLLQTVASVAGQDYPSMEYIVIDDGSEVFNPNAVTETVNAINPSVQLKILINETNRGTVFALNRAIGESSGKYIFNIAADDVFQDPKVISDWVREFESTGALVITAKRDIYDPELRVRLRTSPSKKVIRKLKGSGPEELFRMMYGSNMVVGCCTAQSRELIDQYGMFDERYRIIEDYPRYLRLSREGVRIHFFDRIVVKYRMGGVSSQARFNEVYEKESNSIFEHEVLAYADDKDAAIREYEGWKERTLKRKQFLEKYLFAEGTVRKLGCWVVYGFKDPVMAAQFMQERILIRIR